MEEDETMMWTARFQGVWRGACVVLIALAGCGGGGAEVKDPPLTADPPAGSGSPDEGAATTELQRGEEFIKLEKYAEAKGHIEAALKGHPSARAHFDMGVILEKTKDTKGAEESYKAALKLEPKFADAAVYLAAIYLGDPPRPDEAIGVLKEASAKVPDDVRLRENLAFAYGLKGDVESSSKQYEVALKLAADAASQSKGNTGLKGEEAQIRFAYGSMLFDAKQPEKAAEQLKKALDGVQEDAPTLATLGLLLGSTKAYAECVKAYDRAIKLKPSTPEWLVHRGVCRHGLDDETGAQADYQAALKIDPKYVDAHYYLGMSYRDQKQRAKAVAELEQAAKLGAGTPVGKAAKAKLDELSKQK